MIYANRHYLELEDSYLFTDIARKVSAFSDTEPKLPIIKLGIGDVTLPLPDVVIKALHEGTDEMSRTESFHGYGPEQGYAFLREAIALNDFQKRGIDISADEIFVSDGAKCDTANFLDILGENLVVAMADPVYPVYVDTNIMLGRKATIRRLKADADNGYIPSPPAEAVDLIYLCSPNNPTGSVASFSQLREWVDYAMINHALILFDAAYEAFIRDDAPHSIFEIPGAGDCAVEMRSFSKTAGFTGLRCAYTVIPRSLEIAVAKRSDAYCHESSCTDSDMKKPDSICENNGVLKHETVRLHRLWSRRQTTKYNGCPYIVQKAAAALYTPEGQAQCRANIDYYLENAQLLRQGLEKAGYKASGGDDSPYVWVEVPSGHDSWSFFDFLLKRCSLVTTPGSGFGRGGEGYIRLSAFCSRDDAHEAVRRLASLAL